MKRHMPGKEAGRDTQAKKRAGAKGTAAGMDGESEKQGEKKISENKLSGLFGAAPYSSEELMS